MLLTWPDPTVYLHICTLPAGSPWGLRTLDRMGLWGMFPMDLLNFYFGRWPWCSGLPIWNFYNRNPLTKGAKDSQKVPLGQKYTFHKGKFSVTRNAFSVHKTFFLSYRESTMINPDFILQAYNARSSTKLLFTFLEKITWSTRKIQAEIQAPMRVFKALSYRTLVASDKKKRGECLVTTYFFKSRVAVGYKFRSTPSLTLGSLASHPITQPSRPNRKPLYPSPPNSLSRGTPLPSRPPP